MLSPQDPNSVLSPRPLSTLSIAESLASSWSTGGGASSRPTSYGSDASNSLTVPAKDPSLHAESISRPQAIASESARPRHALMRLRRISMPVVPTEYEQPLSRQLLHSSIPMPGKRMSTASARSCDSLQEEQEGEDGQEALPPLSSRATSILPRSDKRIRKKSMASRRSSMSPSGPSLNPSPSSSRPVSLALPATSPLVASNVTFSESPQDDAPYFVGSTRERKQPPVPMIRQPPKPSVRFSTPPPGSIISSQAYNTAKRTARFAKKDRISNELLETERVYVGVLNDIHEHFLSPLLAASISKDPAHPPILSSNGIKEIFSNFADIRLLASEILRTLEASVASAPISIAPLPLQHMSSFAIFSSQASSAASIGSIRAYKPPPSLPIPRQIGEVLAPILPFLKCYALFVRNFANAQSRLEAEERTNEQWKAFLKERKAKGVGNRLSLSAMLLCIVQRVPRYRLLLNDLLRYTDLDDPDHAPLVAARKIVEEVAQHLESSIKQHEGSMMMLDLQRSLYNLDFQLIVPGRSLLKSGVLVKQGRRTEDERAFFLFSDILVYADIQYPWSRAISASHTIDHGPSPSFASDRSRLSFMWSGSSVGNGALAPGVQFTFKRKIALEELIVNGAEGSSFQLHSSVKSFAVVAATPQIKHEWIIALREAKEDLLISRRTLLNEEDDVRRAARDRRISLPAKPSRSVSTPLYPKPLESALPTSAIPFGRRDLPAPMIRMPSNDADADDDFDDEKPLATPALTPASSESSPITAPLPVTPTVHAATPSTISSLSEQADYFSRVGKLKVYEDYSAPVWVPDSRANRCMRCNEAFAVWRRRHHCRLCGDVVCWACSTRNFAIPASTPTGTPRIGRACDDCYTTCFDISPSEDIDGSSDILSKSIPPSPAILPDNAVPPFFRRAASALDIAGLSINPVGHANSSADARAQAAPKRKPRESVELLRSVLSR